VADLSADARIRDLKRRLELEPGSRLFVSLAEEYRKKGRFTDALSTLQKGLLAHPNYLSAHVALGRAHLEAGQIRDAIATFTKVLINDPGNLVSAKSLADIYLSRGESLEAVKKFKLYRALSGDRTVDETIERLEAELAPPPPSTRGAEAAVLPPPPAFFAGQVREAPGRSAEPRPAEAKRSGEPARPDPPGESSGPGFVHFDPNDSVFRREAQGLGAIPILSRDVPVPEPSSPIRQPPAYAETPAAGELSTRGFATSDVPGGASLREPPRPASPASTPPGAVPEAAPPAEAGGRTLADLYFAQGHYTEALAIYDDLVSSNPFDPELRRMRRDAEARLLPAASSPGGASPDPGLNRRLARVRALKHWLSMVQNG
jgi:tetratricopeptide (TPR) repeat protein